MTTDELMALVEDYAAARAALALGAGDPDGLVIARSDVRSALEAVVEDARQARAALAAAPHTATPVVQPVVPAAHSEIQLPEPAYRERVYAGHGNEDVHEWYSSAQMKAFRATVIAACVQRCKEQAARWNDDRAIYVANECAKALFAAPASDADSMQGSQPTKDAA